MPGRYFVLSRKELFSKIWASPIDEVASELELTPNVVRAICSELHVPVPADDYWVRLRTGLPVISCRMPPLSAGEKNAVRIEISPLARPKWKVIQGAAETAWRALHPLVAFKFRNDHSVRGCAVMTGRPLHLCASALTATERRRLKMMSRIFLAVEDRGITPNVGRGYIVTFSYGGVSFSCRLREKYRKSRRTVPAHIRSKLPHYLCNRGVIPTGLLAFRFDNSFHAEKIKREWVEAPGRPLERMLPEIVNSIETAARLLNERRQHRRKG